MKEIFPNVRYAFTTIPTYPSGQIGFCLASKDAERDMSVPIRKVAGTKYYNDEVHRAAFVLPEFGKQLLETGANILPVLGVQVDKDLKPKKILLLGSGFVARPCAEYVVRNPANQLTIGESQIPSGKGGN